jgi:hypothetical protein
VANPYLFKGQKEEANRTPRRNYAFEANRTLRRNYAFAANARNEKTRSRARDADVQERGEARRGCALGSDDTLARYDRDKARQKIVFDKKITGASPASQTGSTRDPTRTLPCEKDSPPRTRTTPHTYTQKGVPPIVIDYRRRTRSQALRCRRGRCSTFVRG